MEFMAKHATSFPTPPHPAYLIWGLSSKEDGVGARHKAKHGIGLQLDFQV